MIMKKLLTLTLLLFAAVAMQAQVQTQKVTASEVKATGATKAENYAEIEFDTLRHDFGKFSKDDPVVKCVFNFTNVGTAPLIIHTAMASCGCTVADFTKNPVKPGEKGVINVTYDGTDKFPGHFQKTISIRSNAKSVLTRLTIEGTME